MTVSRSQEIRRAISYIKPTMLALLIIATVLLVFGESAYAESGGKRHQQFEENAHLHSDKKPHKKLKKVTHADSVGKLHQIELWAEKMPANPIY